MTYYRVQLSTLKMKTSADTAISRKVDAKKCTRQSRKVIWDMIITLYLTTVAVEPTFTAFLQHSQTYVRGLSCHSFKFLCRRVNSKPRTISFGIVVCTFSDNLKSRNSCIQRGMDHKSCGCGGATLKENMVFDMQGKIN